MEKPGASLSRLVEIMDRLLAPDGCPWDREQTHQSLRRFVLEETYEVLDAIDKRDWQELPGELGDLLLQVLFYAEMAKEEGKFTIDDVLDRLSEKLVARHPHVFGDVTAETSKEVLRNWEALKAKEKSEKSGGGHKSVLDGISHSMPALMEAYKISSRAANIGFDWPNIEGLFEKLTEETKELGHEVEKWPAPGPNPHPRGVAGSSGTRIPEELRQRLEDEVGDLLFVLVNIARYLSLDPESALRQTNRKFTRRFQHMEAEMNRAGRNLADATLEEMESMWQAAKKVEQE